MRQVKRLAMLTSIYLRVRSPGFFRVAAGLLDHVGGIKPALQMSAAEFAFGVFFVAGTLSRLLDFHFVMGKLRRSSHSFGSGQGRSSSLRQSARRIYEIILLEGVSVELPPAQSSSSVVVSFGFLCVLCAILCELCGLGFCPFQMARRSESLTAKFAKDSAKNAKTSEVRALRSTKLLIGRSLLRPHAPNNNFSGDIAFAFNRTAGHPPQHRDLADVSQSVRDGSLKESLRSFVQRRR